MKFRVSADTMHISGPLTGSVILGGWSVSYPTIELAEQAAAWVKRMHSDMGVIGTKTSRRGFVSDAVITEEAAQ